MKQQTYFHQSGFTPLITVAIVAAILVIGGVGAYVVFQPEKEQVLEKEAAEEVPAPDQTDEKDVVGSGREYLVNEQNREDFQINSNVAVSADGRFVVAWESKFVDGDLYGIFARFYDKNRRPITGEVQVNMHTRDNQKDPDIAILDTGNVVFVWESWFQERKDGYEVYGRVFDASGKPLTDEFRLSTDIVDYQMDAAVAPQPGGDFVAAWLSWDDEAEGYLVYIQRFDAEGRKMGSAVRVSDMVVSTEHIPEVEQNAKEMDLEVGSEPEIMAIDTDGEGNVVAVWSVLEDDQEYIWFQQFSSDLRKEGRARRVDSSGAIQQEPYLDVAQNGRFIIAGHNQAPTDDAIEAFALRFDENGGPIGNTIQLNSYTKNWQNYPVVALFPDGSFAAAWESNFQDGDETGIFFRRFNANGGPIGIEQQVNSESKSWQEELDIGVDHGGNAIVTFMSDKGESFAGSFLSDDIFARYFPN